MKTKRRIAEAVVGVCVLAGVGAAGAVLATSSGHASAVVHVQNDATTPGTPASAPVVASASTHPAPTHPAAATAATHVVASNHVVVAPAAQPATTATTGSTPTGGTSGVGSPGQPLPGTNFVPVPPTPAGCVEPGMEISDSPPVPANDTNGATGIAVGPSLPAGTTLCPQPDASATPTVAPTGPSSGVGPVTTTTP